MARINLGKVVPEKGVDYYTDEEKAEFKAEIEEDVTALGETVTAQGTAIATLQLDSAHTIEMTLNSTTYELTLILKNKAGTALATQTINLPNENALTNIEYSNGKLIITKQSGTTSQVDISGLINGLATETALNNLANALKETIGIDTTTYNESQTYNTGDIVIQNEKIYKANQDNITGTFDSSKWDEISLYEYQKLQDEAIEENYKVITKLQEDVEDLTERMEDAENNEMTNTPTPATSHYLQDSADSRFRKFIPIGRTTQESNPTPENPIPIKNTGDNGSVNEKVQNKNLFNQEEFERKLVTGKIKNDNGNEISDSTSSYSTYMIPFKANVPIYVYGWFQRVYFLDSNKNWVSRSPSTSGVRSSVYNLDYDGFMQFQIQNSAYNSNKGLEQVENNSTATSYVPHSEQNISFPLSQGQKFYEGSHPDDDEKVHHKMGEKTLDGTEDWQQNSTYNNVYVLENFLEDASTKEPREMLSTHFIYGGLITQGSSSVQIGKFYQWTTIPKRLILGYNFILFP